MSFNWGAALGAGVNTGINTYTRLQENSRQQEEHEWRLKEREEKEKLNKIYAEVYGAPEMRKEAIPGTEGVGDEGPTIQTKDVAYTPKQRALDFQTRAAAEGVSPLSVQSALAGQYQLSGLKRGEERSQAEDDFSERTRQRFELIKKDPVKFVEDNLGVYNDAKSGHFGDGQTAELIKGQDGSASLIVRDKAGKAVFTRPVTQETAMEALRELSFHEYSMLPGKFRESTELGLRKTEVGLKGREVGIKERESDSTIAKNNASANYMNAAASYQNVLSKSTQTKAARENEVYNLTQNYSKQIQALDPNDPQYEKKKFDIAQQAEAAIALKSGDFSKVAANTPMGRALKTFDDGMKAHQEGKRDTPPNIAEVMGQYGYAVPQVQEAIKSKVADLVAKGKTKEADAEVKKFNSQFRYTPIEMPSGSGSGSTPAQAIPSKAPAGSGKAAPAPQAAISPEITVVRNRGGAYYKLPDGTKYSTAAEAEAALQASRKPKSTSRLAPEVVDEVLKLN